MAGCEGGASSGAPADTYTTTFSSALSGPVMTFSAVTGLAYCFAQLGSMDMSMARGFVGVPSKVTLPVTVPFCGGLADDSVITVRTAAIVIIIFVACMELILLTIFETFVPGSTTTLGCAVL